MTKSKKPVKSRKLKSRKSRRTIKRNRKSRKSVKFLTGGRKCLTGGSQDDVDEYLEEDEIKAIIKNTLGGAPEDTKKIWGPCIRKHVENLTYDDTYVDKYGGQVEKDLYKQAFGKAQWYYNNGDCPP